jgi:hypothetical protein
MRRSNERRLFFWPTALEIFLTIFAKIVWSPIRRTTYDSPLSFRARVSALDVEQRHSARAAENRIESIVNRVGQGRG